VFEPVEEPIKRHKNLLRFLILWRDEGWQKGIAYPDMRDKYDANAFKKWILKTLRYKISAEFAMSFFLSLCRRIHGTSFFLADFYTVQGILAAWYIY